MGYQLTQTNFFLNIIMLVSFMYIMFWSKHKEELTLTMQGHYY